VTRALIALVLVGSHLGACTRPSEDRALGDLAVGSAVLAGTEVEVTDGLAAIRALADGQLELWAQAPDLAITLRLVEPGTWTIVARNTLPDAVLAAPGALVVREPGDRPTVATFRITLPAGTHALRIAPPDADRSEPFRVAAMADIQTALLDVDDVFRAISAVPDARFVIAMGDITERAEIWEYDLFEQQLATLAIPFYTTIGNHELWGDSERWWSRFGRMSFHFAFKGAAFTFADSGDAGIDPLVEDWLDDWLVRGQGGAHVFLTHFPPVDPVGLRYGAFRSTRDGRRLLSRLAGADVDLTLYGHIHTLVEFDNAGIPAYVSGGGGAEPMKLDGIDRHFLIVDIDPAAGAIAEVRVERVD